MRQRTPTSVRTNRASTRQGFTLFEVLLVLGLVLALSSVVLPAVGRWHADAALRQGATDLQNTLIRLRTQAVSTGRSTGLEWTPGSPAYRLIRQSSGAKGAPGGWTREEASLPTGVLFENTPSRSGTPTSILYSADGIAADTEISLVDADRRRARLRVRRLTGTVTVESDP